jgi:hypothetical protein
VTVGRWTHKVKPNAKKRMNLRASPHPNAIMLVARSGIGKACAVGDPGSQRAAAPARILPIKSGKAVLRVTGITFCYAAYTMAEGYGHLCVGWGG